MRRVGRTEDDDTARVEFGNLGALGAGGNSADCWLTGPGTRYARDVSDGERDSSTIASKLEC